MIADLTKRLLRALRLSSTRAAANLHIEGPWSSSLLIWVQNDRVIRVYHAQLELLVFGADAADIDPSALRLRFADGHRDVVSFAEISAHLAAQREPAEVVLLLGSATNTVLRATFRNGPGRGSDRRHQGVKGTSGPRMRPPSGRPTDRDEPRTYRASPTSATRRIVGDRTSRPRSGGTKRRPQPHRNHRIAFNDVSPVGERRKSL